MPDRGDALAGVNVLVTRTPDQADDLAEPLRALGAEVTAIPAIRIEPEEEVTGLEEALATFNSYHGLVFTSVNGVEFFRLRLEEAGMDPAHAPPAYCVGPRTAAAWSGTGGQVKTLPEKFTASEVAGQMGGDLAGKKYLVLRPRVVKTELGEILRQRGAEADELVLYRTEMNSAGAGELKQLLEGRGVDVITYASPSAVRGTVIMAGGAENLAGTITLCIGPTTAEAAARAGLDNIHYPESYTVEGMIEMLPGLVSADSERR
jgi:uroporphyrinogen-III synthase